MSTRRSAYCPACGWSGSEEGVDHEFIDYLCPECGEEVHLH